MDTQPEMNDHRAVNAAVQPERSVRHGGGSTPKDCPFTDEELLHINREFDKANGWSPDLHGVFTNRNRLPETTAGPPETDWLKRG